MSEVLAGVAAASKAALAAATSEIATMAPATALVTSGAFTPAVMFAPGNVRVMVAQIYADARAAAAVLDISTEKGRKAIASLANKVARSKTAIDDAGKELNASHRAEIEKVDSERRYARETLDALKAEVRKDLTAWEDADKARVAGHEAALAAIEAMVTDLPPDASPAHISGLLAQLQTNQPRAWEEFTVRAGKAIAATVIALQAAWEPAFQREAEAAADKLRKAEDAERKRQEATRLQLAREAQIAAEAAEAARAAAEAEIERVRQDAARQAEAASAALAEAEAARAAAEAQAQAYQDRWDAAAITPQASEPAPVVVEPTRTDTAHRLTVDRLAMDGLIFVGLSKSAAKTAINAIAGGAVPNVSINY